MKINGIEYEEIPLNAMMMATVYMNPYAYRSTRPTFQIDNLEKEFELIQLKQSKLSRTERDLVVYEFKRRYRVVKTM